MTTTMGCVDLIPTVVDRPFHLQWEGARINADWKAWLLEELRVAKYQVAEADGLTRVAIDNRWVCSLAFPSDSDIVVSHDVASWPAPPCPWASRVLGYIECGVVRSASPGPRESDVRQVIASLGYLTLGPVVDAVLGEPVLQPLERVQVPLVDTTTLRHGFRDAMVSYDDAYLRMVQAQINERLQEIGIGSASPRPTASTCS